MQRQQAYLQTGLLQQRAGDVDVVPLWHKGSLGGVRAIVHAVDAWWIGHVKHNSTHQTSRWGQNDTQHATVSPARTGAKGRVERGGEGHHAGAALGRHGADLHIGIAASQNAVLVLRLVQEKL